MTKAVSTGTDNGFSRRDRLNNSADFRRVSKSPFRSGDKDFLVLAKRNACNKARLGLAVPKKKVKSAVKRNLVKRTIRESFRRHKNTLAGWDIIVILRAKQTAIDAKAIRTMMRTHWQRISKCGKS